MTQGNTQTNATLNVELDTNSYLPAGGTRLNGSFIISPKGFSGVAAVYLPRCRAAVLDVSGSMDEKGKIGQAKAASRAFVQELPENDYFVIVKYHSHAEFVFPRARNTNEIVKPVLATAENKRLAPAAIDEIKAEDNTYPSYGIDKAFQSFLLSPCDEATVCFLTDGQFNGSDAPKLEAVLKAIEAKRKEGRSFKISPRGIGTDFTVGELRQMADRTLGSAPKVVANPSDLKADFVEWMAKACEATLSNVRIKLWYPGQVKLVELKRLAPSIIDLINDVTTEADGNTHTGPWGRSPPRKSRNTSSAWNSLPRRPVVVPSAPASSRWPTNSAPSNSRCRAPVSTSGTSSKLSGPKMPACRRASPWGWPGPRAASNWPRPFRKA